MNTPRYQRLWLGIVWAVLIIVVLKGGYDFAWRLWYEWHGAYNSDSPVYWAMGRSMVNGLTIYKDLLEIKPPMIFLICALSYWLTDTMIVGHMIQGLVLIGITIAVLLPCATFLQGARQDIRKTILSIFCVGTALALGLYTAAQSGEFQTESFGAFFACSFIATITWLRTKLTYKRSIVTGILLGLAIMTKEPFLLTCVMGSLFLVRSRKEFAYIVILPGITAAIFSLALLGLLGGLGTYLTVYLDYMLNSRVQRFGSPWIRGFAFEKTWHELRTYALAFGILIPMMWATWFGASTTRWSFDIRRFMVGSACALGALLWCGIAVQHPSPSALFFPVILGIVGIGILGTCAPYLDEKLELGWRILVWLGSLYVVTYAAGLSGEFRGHHFIFALPIYTGIFLSCVEIFAAHEDRLSKAVLSICAALATGAVLFPPTLDARARLDGVHRYENEHRFRTLAREMDDVLTACKEDRYLMVGEPGADIFGFTHHSPLGPGFFQYSVNMTEQYFFDGFIKNIQTANVIVQRKGLGRPLPDEIQAYIDQSFTYEPWPCAAPHLNEGTYIFLFRKNAPEALH